jgi:hypothetical protein
MNDTEIKLAKQYLLRVRQEGYSVVENPARHIDGINIDIYRGKTLICTFDNRQLGEPIHLQVRSDDSQREDIKHDYNKLFYMLIDLRDLYLIYENAAPLQGYDQSLGYRAIAEYNGCTLAVNARSVLGDLEFGTFKTGQREYNGYGTTKVIRDNIFFDMDNYPAAKLDFVARSGLLPREQLVTPENIKYLHGSCSMTLDKDGAAYNEETRAALGQIVSGLEKVKDSFIETEYRISAISAVLAPYIETNILDVKGIFTKSLIDRDTLPKGLYAYDIQFSREDMTPEKVWEKVLGRWFGTVITKKPLPIGEKGYTELSSKDFSLNINKRPTLREFQTRSRDAR